MQHCVRSFRLNAKLSAAYLGQLAGPYRLDNTGSQIFNRIHPQSHHEIVPDADGERVPLGVPSSFPTQQTSWSGERVHPQIREPATQLGRQQDGHPGAQTVSRQHQRVLRVHVANSLEHVSFAKAFQHAIHSGHHSTMGGRLRRHSGSLESLGVGHQIGEHVPHR